jgi:hypothetical protein
LARTSSDELREMLADISLGLTRPKAAAAPKLFQLNRTQGPQVVIKLLVVVLKSFVDSVRVPDKMSSAELIETAEVLATTYTHDSLKDIILALKEARLGGYKFYQSVDAGKIFEIVVAYFERKADWLQSQHFDQKARSTSQDSSAVAQLAAAGAKVLDVGRRLDPAHPNHESLRRKLTITNQRQKRGLITAERAEAQRNEVQAANQRKSRPDWQPSLEAQHRIDVRNRAEDKQLAYYQRAA